MHHKHQHQHVRQTHVVPTPDGHGVKFDTPEIAPTKEQSEFPFCSPFPGELTAVDNYPTTTPMPELWNIGLQKLKSLCDDNASFDFRGEQDGVKRYKSTNAPVVLPTVSEHNDTIHTIPMSKGVATIEDCIAFDLAYTVNVASLRYRWDKTLRYLRPLKRFNPYSGTYYCVLDVAKGYFAPRDFYILTHSFYEDSQKAVYILSVSLPETMHHQNIVLPSLSAQFVRGHLFCGWRLIQDGNNVHVTHVSQIDLKLPQVNFAQGSFIDMSLQIARLQKVYSQIGFGPHTLNAIQPGYQENMYCMADASLDGTELECFYRIVFRSNAANGNVVKIRYSSRMYPDGVLVHVYGTTIHVEYLQEAVVLHCAPSSEPIAVVFTTRKPHIRDENEASTHVAQEANLLNGYIDSLTKS